MNKVLFCKQDSTLSEVFSTFANETNVSLNSLIFVSNGEKIDINSNKKIKDLAKFSGGTQTTILVLENKMSNSVISEKEELKSINEKQFIGRNLKGIQNKYKNIIEDMAILGYLTKYKIITSLNNNSQLISVDSAIGQQNSDPQMFILGILGKYLYYYGITIVINNSKNLDEKYKNLCNTILQFVFNGLILKKKYYFFFCLDYNRKEELHKSIKKQEEFNTNLKKVLTYIYGISNEDIMITRPLYHNYYAIIVVFKQDNLQISKNILMNTFMNYPELNKLIEVKEENMIEGIILDKCMLNPEGNIKNGQYGYYEKRGNEEYKPPEGFDRYGLNVKNKYDNCNDDWLSFDGRKGEWCIAYGWLNTNKISNYLNEKYKNEYDSRHQGKKVGEGIYCSQNPEIMNQYTQTLSTKGQQFKLGLMLRVNPDKIRRPQSSHDFWVVNGSSDEIRPYGILIKKIKI